MRPSGETMRAAVYRGAGAVAIERLPVPAIGPGEILVRVESCGICHTDLKKIEYDLLPAPRVYGHETAGVVVAAGEGVRNLAAGDRVCLFHHIPCKRCFYCRHRDYAQCATYKKVGVTAGFEPAGGGFAQYVRVMDWIVERGVERIPDGVSFERAAFVEPVNTCLKGLEKCAVGAQETVAVMGQGPIGLLFTMLLRRRGVNVIATDRLPSRLETSLRLGASEAVEASPDAARRVKAATDGRGADVVITAASAPGIVEQAVSLSRRGGKIMLFAQTSAQERFTLDGKAICAEDRSVFGSYSASVDLQAESARIVWDSAFPLEELISHRLTLDEFGEGMELARNPRNGSLKLIVQPQGRAKP